MCGRAQPEPISITLPAVPPSIGQLRQCTATFASECGAERPVVADVPFAVSEAATNVVKYAYGSDDEGVVELSAAVVVAVIAAFLLIDVLALGGPPSG